MNVDPSVYHDQNYALAELIAGQMETPGGDWSCRVMRPDGVTWTVSLLTNDNKAYLFHTRDDEGYVRGRHAEAMARAQTIFADRNYRTVGMKDHNEAVSMQMKTIAAYERYGGLGMMQNAAYRFMSEYAHDVDHLRGLWEKMAAYLEVPVIFGETFYVSAAIADAVESAAQSLPSNYMLRREVIPAETGIAFLPEVAIGWSVGSEGITLVSYGMGSNRQYLMPNLMLPWSFNDPIRQAIDEEMQEEPDRTKHIVYTTAAMISSLFEFMADRILVTRYQQVNRSLRRRAERSRVHAPLVNVIELRARQYQSGDRESDPGYRDYSVQWIVRGHWRQQWYPSLGIHQPKWITPYVKGPDDKPLKTPRANVFAVVR